MKVRNAPQKKESPGMMRKQTYAEAKRLVESVWWVKSATIRVEAEKRGDPSGLKRRKNVLKRRPKKTGQGKHGPKGGTVSSGRETQASGNGPRCETGTESAGDDQLPRGAAK